MTSKRNCLSSPFKEDKSIANKSINKSPRQVKVTSTRTIIKVEPPKLDMNLLRVKT